MDARWEVTVGRDADVGLLSVRRALPLRTRRTVGSWCFADHMGPARVTEVRSVDVGPHPHIGLQTVTWLTAGEILHRDSLGSVQLVRPGQLNLMTAGAGISHSEEATGSYAGPLHGAQLWVAQPDETRHAAPAFEHHPLLPSLRIGDADVQVMVGTLAGVSSPARADTDHVGADVTLASGRADIAVSSDHEHGVVVLDGSVDLAADGAPGPSAIGPGRLAWCAPGPSVLTLASTAPVRLLLLGGTPWPTPPLMWWNLVARTHDEIAAARDDWERGSPRFGTFASPLERIAAPPLPFRLHVPEAG